MRFATSLVLTAAVAAASALAQSSSGSGSMSMPMNSSEGMGGMAGIDLTAIPPCFKACGQTAAMSKEIGCQSAEDFKCICSKPSYQEVTSKCIMTSNDNECPKLKANQTALEGGIKLLQGICTQVMAGGNMTMSNSTTSSSGTMSTNMTSPSTTSTTSSSSAMPKKNGAAAMAVPTKEFVASVAVVLSALTLGAVTLV